MPETKGRNPRCPTAEDFPLTVSGEPWEPATAASRPCSRSFLRQIQAGADRPWSVPFSLLSGLNGFMKYTAIVMVSAAILAAGCAAEAPLPEGTPPLVPVEGQVLYEG